MGETLIFLIVLGSFYEDPAQALHQPKLTVNSSRIKETDSVTFSCQAPAHDSEYKCDFYVNRGTQRSFSCVKTFTGTELLRMAKQSSPSVVEVRCNYIVKYGAVDSPSPHSDISYITINLKPLISVNYFKGEFATFTCSLPGSVKNDTTCNLYFGESTHPVKTTTIQKKRSRANQWFCSIEIPEDELMKHLRLVQQKQITCDYSLESDGKHLSPHSDPYNLSGIVEGESTEISITPTRSTKTTGIVEGESTEISITPTRSTKTAGSMDTISSIQVIVEEESTEISITPTRSTKTAGSMDTMSSIQVQTPNSPFATRGYFLHTSLKSEDPTAGATFSTQIRVSSSVTSTNKREDHESKGKYIDMWKLILAAAVGGLTVIFILVLSVCLRAKRRTGVKTDQSAQMETIDSSEMLPTKKEGVYCLITSVPDNDGTTGRRKSAIEKPQINLDVYHVYSTIPDLPPSSFKDNVLYSPLSKL